MCYGLVRMSRNISARLQHYLWLLCAAFSAVLPMAAVLGLFSTGIPIAEGSLSLTTPSYVWRFFLVAFWLMAAHRAVKLIQAGLCVRALAQNAPPVSSIPTSDPCIVRRLTTQRVRVCYSPPGTECFGPLLVGLGRTTILLPRPIVEGAKGHLLEAALAHEFAHVERKDILWLVISELMLVPLAFHPVAVFLRRKLVQSRELACDELVLKQGFDRFGYARSLLELARDKLQTGNLLHAFGVGDSRDLECRIRALSEPTAGSERVLGRRGVTVLALALSSCCMLLAEGGRSVYMWVTALPAPSAFLRWGAPPPPPPPLLPRRTFSDSVSPNR